MHGLKHHLVRSSVWLLATFLLAVVGTPAVADDAPPAGPLPPLFDGADEPAPAPPADVVLPVVDDDLRALFHPEDEAPLPAEETRETVRDAVADPDQGVPVDAPTLQRCPPCDPCAPRCGWDVTVEGGISLFDDPSGIIGEPLPAGITPFRWGDNDYGSAFGLRLTIGYRTNSRDRWEVRGTYAGSWEDSTRQTGQFGFRPTPGGALILSPAGASATLTNETDIWGGELNWWRDLNCTDCWQISAGLGARYLRIDDEATADNWVGLAPDSFLQGEVDNGFLGVQLLGSLRMFPHPKVELGVSLKVLLGAMNRDMEETDASMVTGGLTGNATLEETSFAWGLEGEFSVLYRVTPRAGLLASYTILVLDEVGRAEAALDFSQSATGSVQLLDNADIAVLHSFFLGFRLDL